MNKEEQHSSASQSRGQVRPLCFLEGEEELIREKKIKGRQ